MSDEQNNIFNYVLINLRIAYEDIVRNKSNYDKTNYSKLQKNQHLRADNNTVLRNSEFDIYNYKANTFVYMRPANSSTDRILKMQSADENDVRKFTIEFNDDYITKIFIGSGSVSILNNKPGEITFSYKDKNKYAQDTVDLDCTYFRENFENSEEHNFTAEIQFNSTIVSIRDYMQQIFEVIK